MSFNFAPLAERLLKEYPAIWKAAYKATPDDPYKVALERIASALERIAKLETNLKRF